MQAVVYAKDAERLARFYEQVLGLSRQGSDPQWVHLQADGVDLMIVAMPAHLAAEVQLQDPPLAREDTPIKLSFAVNSLLAIRPSVHSYGGVLRPLESAWVWRHQRHLDGLDPEGNVFQLREPLTPT